jgi:hypothetical protein
LKERPAKSAYMSETKTFSCINFTHIGAFGGEKRFFAKVAPLGWWELQNLGGGWTDRTGTGTGLQVGISFPPKRHLVFWRLWGGFVIL